MSLISLYDSIVLSVWTSKFAKNNPMSLFSFSKQFCPDQIRSLINYTQTTVFNYITYWELKYFKWSGGGRRQQNKHVTIDVNRNFMLKIWRNRFPSLFPHIYCFQPAVHSVLNLSHNSNHNNHFPTNALLSGDYGAVLEENVKVYLVLSIIHHTLSFKACIPKNNECIAHNTCTAFH